ncbi:MAG: tetratricopeptide repeat protein [Thermoanaerobaculia bacterium]
MGFLNRLFRKDPAADVARAEEHLGSGRAYEALLAAGRAAEAAPRDGAPDHRPHARELAGRARELLAASALTEADRSEADGDYDDAAEWVASALEHLKANGEAGGSAGSTAAGGGGRDPRVADLKRRLRALRSRAREAARQPTLLRRQEEGGGAPEEPAGPDPLDLETHYGTLVGTLDEEVAERHYLHRPLPFQQAYVDLNEGRLEEALATFDALAAAEPDDPAVRLERGRCRLLSGDPAGAREDFEAAWPGLGDRPLDASGELSVPALWAEAVLAQGDAGTVAERLAELAGDEASDPELVALRGRALIEVGPTAHPEARELLASAQARHPGRQDLPYLLAVVLERMGETDRAIATLEAAVAPSCATGSCKKPPLHRPSARLLVRLHLDRAAAASGAPGAASGPDPADAALERAGDPLAHLVQAAGDQPAPEDEALRARHQELTGEAPP